jgi:hypothetical protein
MAAVAASNEVAHQLSRSAIRYVVHDGSLTVMSLHLDNFRVIDGSQTALGSSLHQIASDLGLTINYHRSSCQILQSQSVSLTIQTDLNALVNQPFGPKPPLDPQYFHQTNRTLFENARPDATQHVFRAAMLQDNVIDAGRAQ